MGIPAVRRAWTRGRQEDEGLALVETVVALLVFALIATGVGGVLITSLAGNRGGLQYQQATRVAEKAVEDARSKGYANLGTSSADLAAASGDATIRTSAASCSGPSGFTYYFTPDGLSHCEGLVSSASGLPLHPTASTSGYSVEQYVTWVDRTTQGGTGQDYKRVTTHVTWTDHGKSKSYNTMTTVSDVTTVTTYRDVAATGTTTNATAVPGYQAVFQNLIANKGTSGDTFNLTVTATDVNGTAVGWAKSLYFDTYLDGSVQPYGKSSPATLLTDTNADGVVDTGVLADTSGSCSPGVSGTTCAQVLLAVSVPSGAVAGTYTFVVTATSTHASTATASVTNTLVVNPTPAALNLYLHNSGSQPVTASTQTLDMPMDTNPPTGSSEPNLSTNATQNNTSGRAITRGGSSSTTVATTMADWIYGTLPTNSTFNGNVTGTIYAQGCNAGTAPPSITVYFGQAATGGDSASTTWIANSGARTVPTPTPNTDCTGSQAAAVNFSIPVSNLTFGQQEVIELKVVASGTKDAVVAYDATAFPSMISLPVVAT